MNGIWKLLQFSQQIKCHNNESFCPETVSESFFSILHKFCSFFALFGRTHAILAEPVDYGPLFMAQGRTIPTQIIMLASRGPQLPSTPSDRVG